MSTTDPGQDPTLAPTDPTTAEQPSGPASQIENAQTDQAAPAAAPADPAAPVSTWSTDPTAPAPAATPATPATPAPVVAPDPTPAPAASSTDSSPTPAVSSPAPSSPSDSSASSAPAEAAPEETPSDRLAQYEDVISKMQSQLADLQSKVSSGQLTAAQVDSEVASKVAELRKDFEDWPQPGDSRPQPWDLQAHELPAPGITRDYLPGGQPDELSPVVIAHNKPILIPGTAGSAVEELAGLLAKAGYATSISQGRNHTYAFDDTITAAVSQFKKDFGVQADPSQFPAESAIASIVVDAWIWEALLRVSGR